MNDSFRTLIAIATYNEMENLPDLVTQLRKFAADAEILVIDDDSPDGTGRWCDEERARDPRFHVIHRSGKMGLGTATLAGMRFALQGEYDALLTMDADFSHHPRFLPALRDELQNADVVIGSRYISGGSIVGWPWFRRLMSRAINAYARLALGLPVRDCSGAFRLYRTDALRRLDLDRIVSRGYSYLEEILWRLAQHDVRFAEVPIEFRDRERGQTKINWREAVSALLLILRFGIARTLPGRS